MEKAMVTPIIRTRFIYFPLLLENDSKFVQKLANLLGSEKPF